MACTETGEFAVDIIDECKSRERLRGHHADRTTIARRLNIPERGGILAISCYNPRRDAERRCETIAASIKKYGYGATIRALRNALRQAERVFAQDSRIVATIRES